MNTVIIDGGFLSHICRHSFDGLGYEEENGEFVPTSVTYGAIKMIVDLSNKDFGNGMADVIGIAWDSSPSERRKIFPEYKVSRSRRESDQDRVVFFRQIKELKKMLSCTLVAQFVSDGNEADDVIAVLSDFASRLGRVVVVANDRDLYQILNRKVSLFTMRELFTEEKFSKEYGINPERWVEVKTIAGCSTDGIPGVPGIGEKTALKLIRTYGDADSVLGGSSGNALKKVRDFGKDGLDFTRKLVTLRRDIPVAADYGSMKVATFLGFLKRKKMSSLYSNVSILSGLYRKKFPKIGSF